MDEQDDFSKSVKFVAGDSGQWYQAEFETRSQAETIRSSEEIKLHPSDDRRQKTVKLSVDTPEQILKHISKNAIDQPSPSDYILHTNVTSTAILPE